MRKNRKYSQEECLTYLEGYWPYKELHSTLASYLWP